MGPSNHVLDGVQIPHGKGQFWVKGAPIVKYRDSLPSCAKTAEPIEMLIGYGLGWAQGRHALDRDQIPMRSGNY